MTNFGRFSSRCVVSALWATPPQQFLRAQVVVVGVEGQHTDDLAVGLVPDREAVVVVDDPALVVAPPAAVLEHGFTDGAGESGHLVPRGREAGSGETGDEPLVGGVAPVLGPDAAAGGDVVGERDIARGIHVAYGGVHVLVDDDASVAGFQPGRVGQPDVGPHTGRGDDEVRFDHGAVVEDHAVLSDLGHAGLADETDAVA